MPTLTSGQLITSDNIVSIMREINAVEAAIFFKGSASNPSTPKVTPGGFLHATVSGMIQVLDPDDGTLLALYSLTGERVMDWGPGDEIWTFSSTEPSSGVFRFTMKRYSESDGSLSSTVTLDDITLAANHEDILGVNVGRSGGGKIYVCELTSNNGNPPGTAIVHRFNLSGSFENKKVHTGDYVEGDGQAAFRVSKETDDNYFLKTDGVSAQWTEYNSDGISQGTLNSNMDDENGSVNDPVTPGQTRHGMSQNDAGEWAFLRRLSGGFETADDAGVQVATMGSGSAIHVALHPDSDVQEVFIAETNAVKVYDSQDGTLLRTLNTFAYTQYTQTEFFRYPTASLGDKESLGTPDGGVSIPALDALFSDDSGNPIPFRPNTIVDMRDAIEAVLVNYVNVVTGNAFNFTASSADNLYHVAVSSGVYDWDRPLASDLARKIMRIDDLNEIDLCRAKLASSALV